ncbi:ribonuclease E [Rhodoligotrophos appendicifer]|uniref:Rne/Rng family ribonuclease n=1 Tax=Rhodoligotrophos appendicifer TaxID=987056 RepID=UPI00118575C5|nr:ribonuclease E/G [Rhodoligotrophos appendicifer]
MGSNMLIDAAHPEETRVVVLRGNKIEEFDYESSSRKQIRGNIYLAKVTRVEPSLQAAFVDYGGNRHGFLAFNEIHPDYYQIPVADRQALLKQEARDAMASGDEDIEPVETSEAPSAEEGNGDGRRRRRHRRHNGAEADAEGGEGGSGGVEEVEEDPESQAVDSVGAEDALEEASHFQRNVRRVYKIQEVIKRRQILLVQVVKEERGNKGAALTTYLSLAGRYCVLMPNTGRGGGISRKITDAGDRRRLKEVAREMEVPEGMGVIVRTAGANRTKVEIKRDYDYLLRQWESIRDLTLQSTAPALIYEEGSIIKRAIRDLYTKDVDQVLIEGPVAHREAREFMKMLMPSHARNVKPYMEPRPLFSRYQVESQLDGLFSPVVTLSSGGYIVINQTEALVSIDVNSGKSTREHNIEDTALKTNLEAADEVARQLRLRDLAGLIVIDFIDMEEKRNNRNVERRMKEALKNDRARIQVGRISHFGLLEMSRQRLRVGMLEGSTIPCPTCQGRGIVRSIESCALSVLRGIEEYLMRRPEDVTVRCDPHVAFYLLNQKRHNVLTIEAAYAISIYLEPSDEHHNENFKVERAEGRPVRPLPIAVQIDTSYADFDEEEEEVVVEESVAEQPERIGDVETVAETAETAFEERDDERERHQPGEDDGSRRRRRRRGRRGGRRNREFEGTAAEGQENGDWVDPGSLPQPDTGITPIPEFQHAVEGDQETEASRNRSRRGRGRRGDRSRREAAELAPAGPMEDRVEGILSVEIEATGDESLAAEQIAVDLSPEAGRISEASAEAPAAPAISDAEAATPEATEPAAAPKRTRKPRVRKTAAAEPAPEAEAGPAEAPAEPEAAEPVAAEPAAAEEPAPKPKRRSRAKPKAAAVTDDMITDQAGSTPKPVPQFDEAAASPILPAEPSAPTESSEASAPTSEPEPETVQHEPEPEAAQHQPEPARERVSAEPVEPKPERPARRGWWQRKIFGD